MQSYRISRGFEKNIELINKEQKNMLVTMKDFDVMKITDSGQCFRMCELEDGSFEVIHNKHYLNIRPSGYDEAAGLFSVEFDCSEEEWERVWKPYFDIETDYEAMALMVDKDDAFLSQAVDYGRGIRILNQDPWEILISFIISQRKSIPAIRTSIERISAMCGDIIETKYGIRYGFPEPERIAGLTDEQLRECGLGYRAAYVSEAARKVASGEFDVYGVGKMNDEELREKLMTLKGVGKKVADCVMLFGYRRLDSFPVDVWIKRALDEKYPEGFPFEQYSGYGGIMQQYIFFYMRNTKTIWK